MEKHEELRKDQKWEEADKMCKEIEELGYSIEDAKEGVRIKQAAYKIS